MKHIQKKYGVQIANAADKLVKEGTKFDITDKSSLKQAKNSDIFATTDKGYVIKCFLYQNNGEKLVIPIPDLSLVYFDSAYNLNKLRREQEKELNKKIKNIGKNVLSEMQ